MWSPYFETPLAWANMPIALSPAHRAGTAASPHNANTQVTATAVKKTRNFGPAHRCPFWKIDGPGSRLNHQVNQSLLICQASRPKNTPMVPHFLGGEKTRLNCQPGGMNFSSPCGTSEPRHFCPENVEVPSQVTICQHLPFLPFHSLCLTAGQQRGVIF